MRTMEYLVTRKSYKEIDKRFLIVGFTDKYWKCKEQISGNIFLVRKSNLKLKGCNVQFYKE
jgi:hypothetical protein